MTINWLEWLGYTASLTVLVSLLMSSVIKLRWINLLGSCTFALYGFLIDSLPVGLLNICTAAINIYYLMNIYHSKEYFKLITIEEPSSYLTYFLDYHRKEIKKYVNYLPSDTNNYAVRFFVLRNMVPAGIFLASRYDENTLKVELDFAAPEYRDFKIGIYIFENQKKYFMDKGYTQFICYTSNHNHIKYLKKMGFKEMSEGGNNYFIKSFG
jgi:hypothetical protein